MATLPGSPSADTLEGGAEADFIHGEGGDDWLRGFGGADTLFGGDGADTLTAHLAPSTLTGGAGADLFGIVLPNPVTYSADPFTAITRITDYSPAQGDRLRLALASQEAPPEPPPGWIFSLPRITFTSHADGPRGYLPLIWTGEVSASAPALGLALPGAALAPFGYLAAWIADPLGGGWLTLDLTGDGLFGAGDRLVRFDGAGSLEFGPGSFAGIMPIRAQLGTEAGDLLLGVGLPDPGPPTGPIGFSWQVDTALDDMLAGGGGADTLLGGAGADVLVGGMGADWMEGGSGDDTYLVDNRLDRVVEGPEQHIGHRPADHVLSLVSYALPAHVEMLTLLEAGGAIHGNGNAGANLLTGNSQANRLLGRDGADTINGGDGADSLAGEAGPDRLDGGDGDDVVDGNAGDDILAGGAGNDLVRGGDGADSLSGNGGDDTVLGGAGNDTLQGHDNVTFRPGIDRLVGGSGDDLYVVLDPATRVIELAGGGADTIHALAVNSVYVLPAEVEGLRFGHHSGVQRGIGNASDNIISGSFGTQWLEGRDGADTLIGDYGADTLLGGAGADLFDVTGWHGTDVILDFAPGLDRIRITQATDLAGRASPYQVLDFADIVAATSDTPQGALLFIAPNFGGGSSSLLLAGVQANALSAADFLFA